ncbi:16S rRNA (guanine(966)-N(2))-methyltransferase RsmD [Tahibacter harae]|uniref:Ribosomal RNA small subunit methyltransferase D n=1 Tax=Tahibacter harae TaxID=2963937 RepID=A0ABT1QNH2_9GAMM|nr:16S rRNA (guanine(966)-N(2))-methyltransferase RsmD [Tahibacter harae]MCQ4164078.1 16S rRNA (guanine(966)-N(2))-methyltransferase RsmD [Tahibacter harae]
MLPPTRGRPAPRREAKPAAAAAPGKIRIIGGHLRNSRLNVPALPGLRPTPERVRETLFNWLAPWVEGARCLDLFAGTGALGLEALSRGAGEVVFVERDPGLAAALRANLDRLRQIHGQVLNLDGLAALARLAPAFDLVFLDPPFDADLWSAAAQRLESGGLLKPHALVYVEAPAAAAPALPPGWLAHREGRAGDVRYVLYRRDAGLA